MSQVSHIFIVTYGRTGSTLLQALLNKHEEVLLFGENAGLHYQLYHAKAKLAEMQQKVPSDDSCSQPFYMASRFDFERLNGQIDLMQKSFFSYYNFDNKASLKYVGFKEVRFDMANIENYLEYLFTTYHKSHFIFLTRDNLQVANSGFFKELDENRVIQHLELLDQRYRSCYALHKEYSICLDYEDLLSFQRYRQVPEFLNLTLSESSWAEVAAQQHSYDQRVIRKLGGNSSFVMFQSFSDYIEDFHIENNLEHLDLGRQLCLKGVLMPYASVGALVSLRLASGDTSFTAEIGLNSPGYARKYPENQNAANARFSFSNDCLKLSDGPTDWRLIANFETASEIGLGRLYLSS